MRRSIDLLLSKGLRVRILNLDGGLDPDDYVRKHGSEAYVRLLAGAPYFWQYLITSAAKQYDLEEPAMKANAVNDVMQHVAKIEDRVEQLEVARSVAEAFKVPESVIFDRLTVAEKQLIQALLQGLPIAPALEPLLRGELGTRIWSRPVLEELVKCPSGSVEMALENVQDEELKREVRAAVLEPFGTISDDQALGSVKQLYDGHLVQKLEEIRQELKQYGSGPAPAELVRRHMEIVAERHRVAAFKA
jgi:DNA primase